MGNSTYWDPRPLIADCEGIAIPEGGGATLPASASFLHGRWSDRNWRNVPGPIFGAITDSCWTGRIVAPDHIAYDDDTGAEFVIKQPTSVVELERVMIAAYSDPFQAYSADGDAHWTPETARQWWTERGRLIEWAAQLVPVWAVGNTQEQDAARGLRAMLDSLENGSTESYLRNYIFWLEERRAPGMADLLPRL
ncbi:ferredoxin [Herbiconiux sp. UC225_62]|uniref:ferredoxin n=1 Tax=Herbiconiux sp. UC225_62 TaxID=3350168 RepID=UPI0036D416FB